MSDEVKKNRGYAVKLNYDTASLKGRDESNQMNRFTYASSARSR